MKGTQREINRMQILETLKLSEIKRARIKHDETCVYLQTIRELYEDLEKSEAEVKRLKAMMGGAP